LPHRAAPWRHQVRLVSALRARGAEFISLDIDDRRIAGVPWPAISQMIAQLDYFLPSHQDVEAMLPGLSDSDALRHIRESNPETAVIAVKRGSEGVIIHAAGAADYVSMPAIASQVVDATALATRSAAAFSSATSSRATPSKRQPWFGLGVVCRRRTGRLRTADSQPGRGRGPRRHIARTNRIPLFLAHPRRTGMDHEKKVMLQESPCSRTSSAGMSTRC